MRKNILIAIVVGVALITVALGVSCASSGGSAGRGRYLAGREFIIPPEEVYIDSYFASINYQYPKPQSTMGVYLYNSSSQMSSGQDGILQIGIQGGEMSFDELPPMNLVLVVDCSASMNDDDKIEWVRESAEILVNKIRPVDSLALVSFSETAQVDFASTRMDSAEKRQRFLAAVNNLTLQGTSDMEKGLTAGYEQALANFREASVNRILFFSDGTEFSSRLNREGAQSGDVRVSLIWDNRNDLDLYVTTPRGEKIYYGRKQDSSGGMLDVDMNVRGETTKPVENIFWPPGRAPRGIYRVSVQNFKFHERDHEPTPFRIEIKNGNNYSYFDGVVSHTKGIGRVDVAAFEYRGALALQQEKTLAYQLAETYRQMGITTTTLGVGVGFDLEFMQRLAEEGGGSSRFISSRAEMQTLFDTDFARMVALVATDMDMTLEFADGVEILETWGYQNRVEGNRIRYGLPGLHLGDYETIMVRYRLRSQNLPGGEKELARFSVNANDLLGKPLPRKEQSVNIVVSENAADGISSGMVLHAGTMLRFAEALKEIGRLYYEGQDTRKNSFSHLENALKITRESRLELENVKIRLDNLLLFDDELEILANYDDILSRELRYHGDSPVESYRGLNDPAPAVQATGQTANLALLQNRLSALYTEIGLSFPAGRRSVAALAPFGIRGVEDDGSPSSLLVFINESALVSLAGNPGIALVERNRIDYVMAEQNLLRQGLADTDSAVETGRLLGAQYIITGQVIPMSAQAIIFARVIDVQTGEIVSAAQVFVERSMLGNLL